MKTIYKYPLMFESSQILTMPSGAVMLYVDMQKGAPYIWAEVDTTYPPTSFTIRMFATGEEIPLTGVGAYIGTFQMENRGLVYHVYRG